MHDDGGEATLSDVKNLYTLASARELLPEARRRVSEMAATVARMHALAARAGEPDRPDGIVAETKAAEALADDQLSWFHRRGVQVKNIDPALLDFPARAVRDGEPVHVLLCWREGEDDITSFHLPEAGLIGREPLDVLDDV